MTSRSPGSTRIASSCSSAGPSIAATGRAEYESATDDEALEGFRLLAETEGIIPALESAHAVAWVVRAAASGELAPGASVLVTLSGRGDKDVAKVRARLQGGRCPAGDPPVTRP